MAVDSRGFRRPALVLATALLVTAASCAPVAAAKKQAGEEGDDHGPGEPRAAHHADRSGRDGERGTPGPPAQSAEKRGRETAPGRDSAPPVPPPSAADGRDAGSALGSGDMGGTPPPGSDAGPPQGSASSTHATDPGATGGAATESGPIGDAGNPGGEGILSESLRPDPSGAVTPGAPIASGTGGVFQQAGEPVLEEAAGAADAPPILGLAAAGPDVPGAKPETAPASSAGGFFVAPGAAAGLAGTFGGLLTLAALGALFGLARGARTLRARSTLELADPDVGPLHPDAPSFAALLERVRARPLDADAQFDVGVTFLAAGNVERGIGHLDWAFRLRPECVLRLLGEPRYEAVRRRAEVRLLLKRFRDEQYRKIWVGYA